MSAQTSSPGAPRRRRRIVIGVAAAAVLAGVIVVALALLGGEKGVSLADAAANIEGESIHARFDLEITGQDAFAFSGTSVSNADQTRGTIDGTLTPDGEQPIEAKMRMIGEDVWIDYAAGGPRLPGGKRWLHMRDKTLATSTMTPSEFVEFLKEAPDVEDLGKEPVLGTRATHFRGNIDAEDLAERTEGAYAKAMAAKLQGADIEMPTDVWVTDDGLPKLMRVSLSAGQMTMRTEVEVLEYGVDVDVQPPPARTVVEESELGG